jgi:hypothetical protein
MTSKVDRTTPCVPLILAASARRLTTQLFVRSLTHSANATAHSIDGTTPLHRVFERGHVDLAWLLIKHGADATAQNNNGTTPLHCMSEWGDVLIEHGTDVTAHHASRAYHRREAKNRRRHDGRKRSRTTRRKFTSVSVLSVSAQRACQPFRADARPLDNTIGTWRSGVAQKHT